MVYAEFLGKGGHIHCNSLFYIWKTRTRAGVIKGSEKTLQSGSKALSREEYLGLSFRAYPTFSTQRDVVYDLFDLYSRQQRASGDRDAADRSEPFLTNFAPPFWLFRSVLELILWYLCSTSKAEHFLEYRLTSCKGRNIWSGFVADFLSVMLMKFKTISSLIPLVCGFLSRNLVAHRNPSAPRVMSKSKWLVLGRWYRSDNCDGKLF